MTTRNRRIPVRSSTWLACKGCGWRLLLVAGLVSGCARSGHFIPDAAPAQPRELFQPFTQPQALPTALVERPPYRLNVADVLEIIYQVKVADKALPPDKGYTLQSEDVIEVKFPYDKSFNQTLVVLADGYVNCLLIGRVRAIGVKIDELEAQMRNAYKRYFKNPQLTITVKEANKKIDELKKAITTAPRGQSRLMPVKPDGTIDLPFVGEVLAYGKTVSELRHDLNGEYVKADLEEVEVTVQLLELAQRRVYVLGEVYAQGMLTLPQPLTVVHAIAASGGPTPRADTQNVLVVRRKFQPIPQAALVNVQSLLDARQASPHGLVPDGERFRYDFYLQDEDLVYVPPTGLAKANDWIDQVFTRGIRPIFPVTGNVGMNFGYQMYNAPASFESRTKGPPRVNATIGP